MQAKGLFPTTPSMCWWNLVLDHHAWSKTKISGMHVNNVNFALYGGGGGVTNLIKFPCQISQDSVLNKV